jgi:excisionase family DNA binding protein
MEEADHYTSSEAARILRVSPQRIRQMLASGELEGAHDPVTKTWRIPQRAVHARLEERGPREPRGPLLPASEYQDRLETLSRELGRLEGRLQLSEQAESTLRETLERERERADRLEEELRVEREKLEAERTKGFWQRMFGR